VQRFAINCWQLALNQVLQDAYLHCFQSHSITFGISISMTISHGMEKVNRKKDAFYFGLRQDLIIFAR
jgi:hypothetical protein